MPALSFPYKDEQQNPLVSVLLCTRGRSQMMLNSICSLWNNAAYKDRLELVLRADSDDAETIETCRRLTLELPNSQLWVSPRGKGYLNIHNWTYTLMTLARGDWVMIWNDDAVMKTQGWDSILRNYSVQCWHSVADVCALAMIPIGRGELCTEFMFLRRKMMVDILRGFGKSPHADNWMLRVMSSIQSIFGMPLEIEHHSGTMEDQTRKDSVAAYKNGETAKETLESEWAQAAIRDDAQKLLAYILCHNTP